MGSRLVALTQRASDLMLAGALESAGHACVGRDVGECVGSGSVGVRIGSSLERAARRGDVVIEFSTPEATAAHAMMAARLRCPMVIGTTGLSPRHLAVIRRASRAIPMLLSPNMSLGVNVLFQLVEQVIQLQVPHDISIIETHHIAKRDAPSGTAKRLCELVAQYGKHPSVHSLRLGDVVGDHQVIFATPGERLELTHRATSRDTFAHGALRAARFIARQRRGLYDMRDVLGLR